MKGERGGVHILMKFLNVFLARYYIDIYESVCWNRWLSCKWVLDPLFILILGKNHYYSQTCIFFTCKYIKCQWRTWEVRGVRTHPSSECEVSFFWMLSALFYPLFRFKIVTLKKYFMILKSFFMTSYNNILEIYSILLGEICWPTGKTELKIQSGLVDKIKFFFSNLRLDILERNNIFSLKRKKKTQ